MLGHEVTLFKALHTGPLGTLQGLAYPYHWGALRPAQSAAFLALQYSQQIRSSNPSYSARLFNYAQFQVSLARASLWEPAQSTFKSVS